MKLEDVRKQPEIIVLIGIPGSGKSTWRDNMLAKTDVEYVVLSSDDEIERMASAQGMNYTQGFKQFVGKATGIVKQKFQEAVNNDENIIWDQTNLTAKKRKGILQQVPDHYRKIAVAFEVDDEELTNRLARREQETGKHIPPEVVKNMGQSYVPPSKAEGFDEVYIM